MSLLVRALVYGVVDQVIANPAVVEKCVALGGRTVRCRLETIVPGVDEKSQEHSLDALNSLGITEVALDAVEFRCLLGALQVGHARRGRVSFEAVVAGENPQRPTVGPDLVDVEYAQSLCGEDLLDCQ